LDEGHIADFYTFLMGKIMEHSVQIIKVNPVTNTSKIQKIDMFRITKKQLIEVEEKAGIINLSSLVNQWITDEIIETSNSYKFESMPCIIPIYLDIRDPETGYNIKNINVMEGLHFDENGDNIQKIFVWEIHSLICQTSQGHYYAITIDHNNVFMAFSDKHIPSNWIIDTTDMEIVKNIMKEVRCIFYKIQ
jgi:hypothetical protein